jgi:asparagine synthase (glutamine-hydrolysing)
MCGVAGFVDRRCQTNRERMTARVGDMADALAHRGPDGSGAWVDPATGVALGHRRLAILDLSAAGHQPMHSRDGRFVVSYNGEVYNHTELRADLTAGGHAFNGTSDTETIVEAIAAWGLQATAERLIGMFALAVWDRSRRELHLVRDRMGIKPLYYGTFGALTVFGSSLAAVRQHPEWPREIDRGALTELLRVGYIPAPRSIFAGVRKLVPGQILTVTADGDERVNTFWNLRELAQSWRAAPHQLDDTELVDALETLLGDAVSRRMIADVPLGAFLSGGIDSSTVTAFMQAHSDRPVRTFSIGFHEQGFDEATYAKEVAQHLGTDHTELYVTPAQARELIPDLPKWYDEPFADPSQIPTLLLSQLTRRHVTVALSGDGGDELFAGYNRYLATRRFWRPLQPVPRPLRRAAAVGARSLPTQAWDAAFALLPRRLRPPQAGDKVHKFSRMLEARGPAAFYRNTITHWPAPEQLVLGGKGVPGPIDDPSVGESFPDTLDWMQYVDSVTYLPDDILTKVDRASMACSLEARVPILDHRVVEFAWRIPPARRIRDGQGKWALRQVLYRYLPQALVDRPKMGFGIPVGDWLRGPLRDWADDLLSVERLERDGLFDPASIRQAWQEHRDGSRNWQYQLWNVLMVQGWLSELER